MNTINVVATTATRPGRGRGSTWRLVIATALACVLATLGAAGVGAAGPTANPNVGEVVLTCDNGEQVTIWVNGLASDLSNGGSPAHVVDGDAGHVFKALSWSVAGFSGVTRFPGPPPLERVECTHESPDGLVTLTGVFIP